MTPSRRIILPLFVAIALAGCQSMKKSGDSESATKAHDAKVKQTLADGMQRYTNALVRKDIGTLQKLWADDLVFIDPHGRLLSKEQRLANIRAGQTSFKQIDTSEQVIRPHGDHAVATARVLIAGQYSGQQGSGDYRVTMVWEDRRGDWQITAIQMTRIQ